MLSELPDYFNKKSIKEKVFRSQQSIERIAASIAMDGNNIDLNDFIKKCNTNGVIKVLKSLGLYEKRGISYSKTFLHEKILLLFRIESSPENCAKAIISLVDGHYRGLPAIEVKDYSLYNSLPSSKEDEAYIDYKTYVVYFPSRGLFKIGRTRNIERRIYELRLQDLDIKNVLLFDEDIEGKLHQKFNKKRVELEFFDLSKEDLLIIKNY
jgi:hypothetical protein